MMNRMDRERYREVQSVPTKWRRLGLAGAAIGLAGFAWALSMDPPGTAADATAATLGLTVLVLVGWMAVTAKLVVEVTDSAVEVRWWILLRRTVLRDQIASARAVTYHPMREFGGWGIRFGHNGSRAYSMSGDRGVELTLTDGKRIVLGSLDPDPLAAAFSA